jgi:hypothetical protein
MLEKMIVGIGKHNPERLAVGLASREIEYS